MKKVCPFCAEEVKAEALLCKHCRKEIYPGTCLNPECGARNPPGSPSCGSCNGIDLIPPKPDEDPAKSWERHQPGRGPGRKALAATLGALAALVAALLAFLQPWRSNPPVEDPVQETARPAPPTPPASPWLMGTPLPTPRVYHSLVHWNGRLYSLGGAGPDGSFTDEVRVSRLDGSGRPGPWVRTTALPEASNRFGAVAIGGRIYVVGNSPGSPRVLFAAIRPDGTLGVWERGADLPLPLFISPAVTVPASAPSLYVVAGQALGNIPQSAVYRSVLDPATGAPKVWRTLRPMPEALTSAAAVTAGARLYVLGGTTDAQWATVARVWSAGIDGYGDLGEWRREPDLPQRLRDAQALFARGRLYLFGGFDAGGKSLTEVVSAAVGPDGVLDAWTPELPLRAPLNHHAAASSDTALYASGIPPEGQGAAGVDYLPLK